MLFLTVIGFLLVENLWSQCEEELYPFVHGVASGDATSSEVILWTRLSLPEPGTSETLHWIIAENPDCSSIIQFGTVMAEQDRDYTAKVDVKSLIPDHWYYYCFEWNGIRSATGRTHTLPLEANQFTFAAFSCASFERGYYNAYRDAALRNDLQAVFHLGDYYYEYSGVAGPGGRQHDPPHSAYTLDDYRRRHAQVASDPDAQWLRRQYPWYVIWDDHEFADDAWLFGSPAHDNNVCSWEQRKSAAKKAYYEWMPIRENVDTTIHRAFEISHLLRFIFVDSRIEGRMQQVSSTSSAIDDSSRSILGHEQFEWLQEQLMLSENDQWNIILNSVMINKAVDQSGYPIDNDIWEGYRSERDSLLRFIHVNGIDHVVSIAGDYHSSWAGDLPLSDYDTLNHTGSVGAEISVCATTSSPHSVGDISTFMVKNPHIKWIEQTMNGYLVCTLNHGKVMSQWTYVSTINDVNYTKSKGKTIQIDALNPFLVLSDEDLTLLENEMPIILPSFKTHGILWGEEEKPVVFPNPARDQLSIKLNVQCGNLELSLFDVLGRRVKGVQYEFEFAGHQQILFPIHDLAPGYFLLHVRQKTEEILLPVVISN